MSDALVIAYHLVWTVYGWWLPNDPRGSDSDEIKNPILRQLGELHRGRKKVQPASRDIRRFYEQARELLKHPLRQFTSEQFPIVAAGFADAIAAYRYTCYACVVMPDHVHLLIRKHKHRAEEMIENFQAASRAKLIASDLFAFDHPVWCVGGYKVYLDHPDEIRRTIRYIDDNPIGYRLPRQHWDFVTPYDNWPLHAGHNPNSPYARALRAEGRYPHDRNR